ncbi:hypothetical protein PUNSTDRAFT_42398 [Punctularia strigosozonata HHB-11173 SS5]|uniref:uncharacterized protein n=1 Tax=Punctularia strigosozonata (strain HHB-11173) TaxID=741275 RepID=UPI0004416872|nr:uncharacterized protein PUNSTDRAFT_42398 [Punctularia strigosozonata HHB-11173 SS5]EIN12949.1 hypothetical protein PUNSTDRAFT_42398 [Punctularia strigosozonata HHB-11173 SS5]
MQLSRIASFFFVLLTFAVFALATPAKRAASSAEIESILTNLQSELSSIGSKVTNGQASNAAIAPLIDEMIAGFQKASSSVAGHTTERSEEIVERRDLGSDLNDVIKQLLDAITMLLDNIANAIPDLGPVITDIENLLDQLLGDL